jgi:hypothetical protein
MRVRRVVPLLLAGATLALSAPGVAGAASKSSNAAKQLVLAAIKASSKASGFTIQGSVGQGADKVVLNLSLSDSKHGKGTLVNDGQTISLLQIGNTVYFKADKAFWTSNGGAAAATLFANRWVYGPASNKDFTSFASFLNPRDITGQFLSPPPSATFREVGTSTVNGSPVTVIAGKGGAQTGTLDIASHGTPYIVRLKVTGGTSGAGTVTFTNFNKSVSVKAPKGAINLVALENSGS